MNYTNQALDYLPSSSRHCVSNEDLIRQKYESMSQQSDEYSDHQMTATHSSKNIATSNPFTENPFGMLSNIFNMSDYPFDKYFDFGSAAMGVGAASVAADISSALPNTSAANDDINSQLFAQNFSSALLCEPFEHIKQEDQESEQFIDTSAATKISNGTTGQNNSSQGNLKNNNYSYGDNYVSSNSTIFQVIQPTIASSFNQLSASDSQAHLTTKMKRIMKREKAKQRYIMSQRAAANPSSSVTPVISNSSTTAILEEIENISTPQCDTSCNFEVKMECQISQSEISSPMHSVSSKQQQQQQTTLALSEDPKIAALQLQCQSGTLDAKQQKKVQQMIRNRISAQNSRDRKKAYINKLESDLNMKSDELKQSLSNAKSQLEQEKNKGVSLQQQLQALEKQLREKGAHTAAVAKSSLQSFKMHGAFNVALLAFLGVVMIFNTKPTQNQMTRIQGDSSSMASRVLSDLTKSTPVVGFKRIAKQSLEQRTSTSAATKLFEDVTEVELIEEEVEELSNDVVYQSTAEQQPEETSSYTVSDQSMNISSTESLSAVIDHDGRILSNDASAVKAGQWISVMARKSQDSHSGPYMRIIAQVDSVEEVFNEREMKE